MKYEFTVNGTIKLIIKPENNLEKELFKELFEKNTVEVKPVVNMDEIVIEKVNKV